MGKPVVPSPACFRDSGRLDLDGNPIVVAGYHWDCDVPGWAIPFAITSSSPDTPGVYLRPPTRFQVYAARWNRTNYCTLSVLGALDDPVRMQRRLARRMREEGIKHPHRTARLIVERCRRDALTLLDQPRASA